MSFLASTYAWQRRLLAGGLVFGAIGFWRATYDVFNTFKATVVALSLLGIVVAGAIRVARTRRLRIPSAPAVWVPLSLFALGLLVATAVSSTPWLSVVGRAGRHTGLAMYLVYLGLLLAALRLHVEHSPVYLLKALLAGAVPVLGYGLLQALGVEPFGWKQIEGGPPVFSTFGNANFYSAWIGTVVPIATWAALSRRLATGWRTLGAVMAPFGLIGAFLSESLPGPVIGVVGAALVVAARVWDDDKLPRRHKIGALGAGAAVLVLGAAGLAAGAGPFAGIRASALESLGTRTPKWTTALAMWRDQPLFGVGLDTFGDYFYRYRPAALAAETGLRRSTDAPHNVFMDMLAGGGLLLALAYVAVTVVVAAALITGLRRTAGEDRLLLAAVGGAWLAYQLQTLVSINVPPLAALGWVLSGLVLALGWQPAFRQVELPGAPSEQRRPGTATKRRRARQAEKLLPLHPGIAAVIVVAGLGATWMVLMPLRADLEMGEGTRAEARGDGQRAQVTLEEATRVGFWEARYPARLGGLMTSLRRPEEALSAHEEAARREPGGVAHWINIGRVAASLGDHDKADAAYDRLLEVDPSTPETLQEVALYRAGREDYERAEALLERAVSVRDDSAELWTQLGDVRSRSGDTQAARDAYEQAVRLDPNAGEAEQALDELARR